MIYRAFGGENEEGSFRPLEKGYHRSQRRHRAALRKSGLLSGVGECESLPALALSPDGNTLLVAAANLIGGGDKLSELFVSIRDPQTGKFGPFAARVSSETERYRGLAFAPSIPQDPIQYVFLHKDLSVEVYLLSDLLPGANPSPNWSTSVNDLGDANYVASDMVVLSPSSFAAVYTHLTKPSIVGVWLGEGTLGKVSVKKAITGAQSVANGVAKALGTFSSEKTLVGMVNARCDGVIAITAETPYVEYWRYRCQ